MIDGELECSFKDLPGIDGPQRYRTEREGCFMGKSTRAGPYVPIQLQRNSLAVQRSRVGQMRVAKSKRVRLLRQLAVTEPIHRDRRCLMLT